MPRATLRVEVPRGTWASDVTRAHPEVTVEVVSVQADDEAGVGVAEVSGEVDEVESALEDAAGHASIESLDVVHVNDDGALVQFETRAPMVQRAALASGAPLETPFRIRDGVGEWDVTATRETLSALVESFEEIGLETSVERVGEPDEDSLLTDRQRELLELAREMGYYDTPRRTTLSEVADEAGMAKSTCSELLHRAESKVVESYLGPSVD